MPPPSKSRMPTDWKGTTTLPYSSIVIPFALSGIGMAMYFAPVANVVLSSVEPD